ncbi:MAG: hypothetical protein NXI16_05145 [Alphaproteobacteria bacterium]|nr:hypothetical protein [Alphaproteobacteria bacterium]
MPATEFLKRVEDSPKLAALLRVWRMARPGPDKIPPKIDLDPVLLGREGVMPYIWLAQITEAREFRVALVGDQVRENFPSNPVDKLFPEFLSADHARDMTERYLKVVEDRMAEYSEGPVLRGGSVSYYGRRILLPLAAENWEAAYAIGVFQKEEVGYVDDKSTGPTYLAADVQYCSVDLI